MRQLWRGWVLVVGVAAGCAAPLRVGPFVEATVEVRSAVVTAGSTVEAELKRMEDGTDFATRFRQLWGARVQAMDALVAYAEALQAITTAGERGQEAVSGVADGVSQLARAAGIALPAAGTMTVVTDTAKLIYQQVALARSARSLEEALVSAQPAVEEIARHIELDLGDAATVFEAANANAVRRLTAEHDVEIGFRAELLAEQREIYAKGARTLSAGDRTRLQEIATLLDSTEVWHEPLQAEVDRLAERRRLASALFAAAMDGVGEWAASHDNLVVALQERRPVNATSLLQAALDIRELIRRMREL